MTTLEKLGTVAMGYALLVSLAAVGELPWLSHGAMAAGSVLLLIGDKLESWLWRRFPGIDW